MTTVSFQQPDEGQRLLYGWGLSLLVHSLVAAGALALVSDLRPVPEPEPFRWEVALVEAPALPARETPEVQASAAEMVPSPAPQPVQTQPVAQPVQPVVQAVQPVRRTESVRTVKPVEQVVRQAVRQELAQMAPFEPAKVEARPRVEARRPVEASSVKEVQVPAVRPTQAVQTVRMEQALAQVTDVSRTQTAEPNQSLVAAVPPVVEQTTVVQQTAQAPQTAETVQTVAATPLPQPVVTASAPVKETAVVRPRDERVAARAPAPAVPDAARSSGRAAQVPGGEPVAMVSPGLTTDYRWVAESLWHRIHRLRRYPHEARVRHLEGRVVLRVVINDQGALEDVDILESSGHELLDQDAVQMIRRACPLKLTHALGRPQVGIQVPIVYRLEQ
ncbi:TonB family protein [Nitrospira sp. Kam-Ns4a]